jgi:hypothetical protein
LAQEWLRFVSALLTGKRLQILLQPTIDIVKRQIASTMKCHLDDTHAGIL